MDCELAYKFSLFFEWCGYFVGTLFIAAVVFFLVWMIKSPPSNDGGGWDY